MGHVPKILKSENWNLTENHLNTGHTSLTISQMRYLTTDFAFISAIFFKFIFSKREGGGWLATESNPIKISPANGSQSELYVRFTD